jgi:hypothetical protein
LIVAADFFTISLPQSAVGKAAKYTLSMWPKLERCFEYEQVELSNNLAENSMRPVALGRKNWLHVGSAKAAQKSLPFCRWSNRAVASRYL